MSQSRTLFIGMAVHQEPMAVAYSAQEHGAAVTSLGTLGTRQCDSAHRIRKMPSKATPVLCLSEAGPCGDGLYRYLTHKGYECWVVAPSRIPPKAGDRVTTDRRDAGPRARLARSGALRAVAGPQGADEARRARSRAREDTRSDLLDAKLRRTAFLRRHAIRYPGRANWRPAPLRGRSAGVCPPPAQPLVCQA